MRVPVALPSLGDEEGQAAFDATKSGWVTQGPRVAEFENAVAARVGARHAIATSSATTGLHLALAVLGIGPGDEVIVPSLTFIASPNAIVYTGATVVFADVDERTFNVDAADIERRVTRRTKAIMPVDQHGLACDIDAVNAIAKRHGLAVVEDAAPAIGELYKGRPVGANAPLTVFSFHPRKVITTGEGGMITTDDDELASRARTARSHGMSVSDLDRHAATSVVVEEYDDVGFNYRLNDIQAAVGLVQLGRLDELLTKRRAIAERYGRELPGIRGLEVPHVPAYARHTYQGYCVRVTAKSPIGRDDLMNNLLRRGIATRRGCMASHLERAHIRRWGTVTLARTEEIARSTVLLPIFPSMSDDQQDYVIQSLRKELGSAGT